MKVRVLWVPPAERFLKSGKVYNLADDEAQALISGGEAEKAGDDAEAEDDPRPPPEPEPAAEPGEAAAEAPPAKAKK